MFNIISTSSYDTSSKFGSRSVPLSRPLLIPCCPFSRHSAACVPTIANTRIATTTLPQIGGMDEELHATFDGNTKLSTWDKNGGKVRSEVGGKNGATCSAAGCAHGDGMEFGVISLVIAEGNDVLLTEVWDDF